MPATRAAAGAPAGLPGLFDDTSRPPAAPAEAPAAPAASFIETQFPVSRLSKESYKERKANYSQTLTGLGKWWGRKPLVLVRAVLLGLLMPASGDSRRDREVFLALLTMDDEGLRRRKRRAIPLREVWRQLSARERAAWFAPDADPDRPRPRKGLSAADRERLQLLAFDRLGYDEKLVWCDRPEHVEGPSPEAWRAINAHLGTAAASLPELLRELGRRRFGRVPRVGDAFCGGGSVPFEAARLGCEAFGSDLNPVAALLTWGALRVVGGGEKVAGQVRAAQEAVFEAVDRQVAEWGIEHDEAGWRADAFLYCAETVCPACGWRVPLAPGWVIGEKTRAIAELRPEPAARRFAVDVRSGVGREELAAARAAGTVKRSRLECPRCGVSTPMSAVRGDRRDGDGTDAAAARGAEGEGRGGGRGDGLRRWENDDLVPRPDDVFGERLYCVRWRPPRLDALLRAEQDARAVRPVDGGGRPDQAQTAAGSEGIASSPSPGGRAEPDAAQAARVREGVAPSAAYGAARAPGPAQAASVRAGAAPPGEPAAASMAVHVAQAASVRAGSAPSAPDGNDDREPRPAPSAVAGGAPAPPVPEGVDLDRAISALAALLDAAGRRELAALRRRDWRAEDRELEEARGAFEAARASGRPPGEREEAARRLGAAKETVARRDGRAAALAKSIPGALYRAAGRADEEREARALALLRERFPEWQARGYVPSRAIAPGDETSRLLRERGWTHWHHLFTPRQLLVHGLLAERSAAARLSAEAGAACLLGLGRVADWDSRLSRWWTDAAHEKVIQTFSNQALNTLVTFGSRGMRALADSWFLAPPDAPINAAAGAVRAVDARTIGETADVWITDPPYADAINYHELSEFFLAWYDRRLADLFPGGYTDSRRALAVRGAGAAFHRAMVESYRNLAARMPADGVQVVMFTHQDAGVWADLALILWSAGLRVSAAWTVGTETPFGVKEGNYVQGTVLMVLRRQTSRQTAFLDEIVPEVEAEVRRQLDSMLRLDDREAPNFSDADYQLAAYAAALRVLTACRSIEDVDAAGLLARGGRGGGRNPMERVIADAVRTASDFLVPRGLPADLWRTLGPDEKLYLKGLEVEGRGEFRAGVYQEFARGFGVRDYRALVRTGKANETRLRTASEFARRELGGSAFGAGLVRRALYAVWRTAEDRGDAADGLRWLRAELPDYWPRRAALAAVLRYLAARRADHWREDAAAARVLAGAVENDHV